MRVQNLQILYYKHVCCVGDNFGIMAIHFVWCTCIQIKNDKYRHRAPVTDVYICIKHVKFASIKSQQYAMYVTFKLLTKVILFRSQSDLSFIRVIYNCAVMVLYSSCEMRHGGFNEVI